MVTSPLIPEYFRGSGIIWLVTDNIYKMLYKMQGSGEVVPVNTLKKISIELPEEWGSVYD
jgi:hypothetical protein